MGVMLLTPFTMVNRRSAPMGGTSVWNPAGNFLTGRWGVENSSGEIDLPGTNAIRGIYLILEGNLGHNGTNLQFGNAAAGFASTSSFELPSVQQSGELALAYGVFRYQVGPEGCDPLATFTVGHYVSVDQYGRIIPSGSSEDVIGKVESVTSNASGVTELVIRTFGV